MRRAMTVTIERTNSDEDTVLETDRTPWTWRDQLCIGVPGGEHDECDYIPLATIVTWSMS